MFIDFKCTVMWNIVYVLSGLEFLNARYEVDCMAGAVTAQVSLLLVGLMLLISFAR